jgi:hypothetical protein
MRKRNCSQSAEKLARNAKSGEHTIPDRESIVKSMFPECTIALPVKKK